MSYVFPYGSNLCNNIQSWMRVGDQTPLSNGRDHPSRCDFHIHGTQILSFWHPLGHIDHGLRAWRASWVRPHTHTHTNTHTYQTYTHMPSYSFSKEDAFTLWVSVRQTVAVKEEKKKKKLAPREALPEASVRTTLTFPDTPAEPHWAGSFLIWHTVMTKQEWGRGGEQQRRPSPEVQIKLRLSGGVAGNFPLRQWCLADQVTQGEYSTHAQTGAGKRTVR